MRKHILGILLIAAWLLAISEQTTGPGDRPLPAASTPSQPGFSSERDSGREPPSRVPAREPAAPSDANTDARPNRAKD